MAAKKTMTLPHEALEPVIALQTSQHEPYHMHN